MSTSEQTQAGDFTRAWGINPDVGRLVLFVCLAGLPVLFVTSGLDTFEYPKALWVRACMLCLAVPALIVGLARPVRSWQVQPSRFVVWFQHDMVSAGVLLILASALVSTLTSLSPRISWWGEHPSYGGLTTLSALALVYLAARVLGDSLVNMERLLSACLLGGLGAAAFALLQFAGADPVAWEGQSTVGAFQRPFGTLGHPNHLGAYLALVLPLALYFAAPGCRWGMLTVGLAILAGLLVTLSRAAWLACGVSSAVWLAARLRRVGDPRARVENSRFQLRLLGCLAVCILALILIVWWNPRSVVSGLRDRVTNLTNGRLRFMVWKTSLELFLDRPLVGVGPDAFQLAFLPRRTPAFWDLEWNSAPTRAHNEVLQVLATQGLIGALTLGVFGVGLWQALRRALYHEDPRARRLAMALACGCVAYCVSALFNFTTISSGAAFLVFVAFLSRLGSATSAPPVRRTAPHGLRIAVAAVAGLTPALIFLVILPWRAHVACARGDRTLAEDPERALLDLERAVALDAAFDLYWTRLARGYQEAAARTTAPERRRAWLLRAHAVWDLLIRRSPRNGFHQHNRALCLATMCREGLGSPEQVLAAFEAALQRDPTNPVFYADAADAALRLGRNDLAQELAAAGLKHHTGYAPLYGQIGYLHLVAGNLSDAIANLEEAAVCRWDDGQPSWQAAARANLIAAYYRQGDFDKVAKRAPALLEEYPAMTGIRAMLAEALAATR